MIAQGIYMGKILGYAIQKTKKGEPEPTVTFQVTDANNESHQVYWRGSLNNETGIDITLKALQAMGMQSSDDLPAMAQGIPSKVLNTEQPMRLTIVHETYNGNTTAKVKWVNHPGEKSPKASEFNVDKAEAAKLLNGLNLRSKFNSIKNGEATKASVTPISSNYQNLDDIPF